MKDPDWLLDSSPRKVQIEALRRSYGGFVLMEGQHDECGSIRVIRDGPTAGWGHYLEMRLGKTPTTINEFELFMRDYNIHKAVVVAPQTFKQGWIDESVKSGSSVPWLRYDAKKVKELERDMRAASDGCAVVVNYEALKTENFQRLVGNWVDNTTYLAFDESIKLKGHTSQQTKVALTLAKDAKVKRVLSGLPMTQGPQDLYAQMRAISAINGQNYFAFRNKFCVMGGFKNKQVKGVKNEDQLQEFLRQNSFVAKRKDWSKPGASEYHPMSLDMTPKQSMHYNAMDKEFITWLESGEEIAVDVVVSKMQKLQQISSGFLYHEGRSHYFDDPKSLPKTKALLDVMEETTGKIVVCYHYSSTGDMLHEVLQKWDPAVIRGQLWMKKNGLDVDSEKKRFNMDPSCRVILVQISSGKYGHDLTGTEGDRCATMVFYENTYSLDDRTQVEMRNTTAFQDWSNLYLDFYCSKVERNAIDALAKKTSISDAVLGSYK